MTKLTHPHPDYIGRRCTIKDSGSPKIYAIGDGWRVHPRIERTDIQLELRSEGQHHGYMELDRIELTPETRIEKRDRTYLNTDHMHLTSDEALDYFAFVMMQAGVLMQNIPSDPGSRDELLRILTARGENPDGPLVMAALAYYDSAFAIYDKRR